MIFLISIINEKKIYHSNPSLLLDENVCIIGSSKSILKKNMEDI